MGSESPRRTACCFCFSTKKNDLQKSSSKGVAGTNMEDRDWEQKDELLSDLSTFSVDEQERRMKKALKEEERVSREAERVVQWVKQESARMDASVINAVLSKNEGKSIK